MEEEINVNKENEDENNAEDFVKLSKKSDGVKINKTYSNILKVDEYLSLLEKFPMKYELLKNIGLEYEKDKCSRGLAIEYLNNYLSYTNDYEIMKKYFDLLCLDDQYKEASMVALRIMKRYPSKSNKIYYDLASVYYKLEQYDLAYNYYRKSWDYFPKDTRNYTNMFEALNKLGLNKESKDLEKQFAFFKIGLDMVMTSQVEAVAYLTKILKRFPNYDMVLELIGEATMKTSSDPMQSEYFYLLALKLNPENYRALLGLARLYKSRDAAKALEYYKQAYDINKDDYDLTHEYPLLLASQKRWKKAYYIMKQRKSTAINDPFNKAHKAQITVNMQKCLINLKKNTELEKLKRLMKQ